MFLRILIYVVVAGGLGLFAFAPDFNLGAKPQVTDPGQWPERLRLAFTPSEDDPEKRRHRFQELADYLTQEIGIPVEITRASSYGPTIEAMRAHKIDIAQTGSFAYMIAHEKAGAEAIITRGTEEGPGIYNSVIVTSPLSGIDSIDEMINRADELTFSFTDPASTSGHLVPRSALESFGIEAERDFRRVVFTMSHTNSAMTILSGKVEVGGISGNTYQRLLEADKIEPGDLKILWESPPIPTGPLSIRGDLPEDLKKAVQQAYLDIRIKHPVLWADIRQASGFEPHEPFFYLPAEDSMWDPLREIARNLETMDLL
ncbi:MAG: phosphate/phosphite/phosphonate ABC transporter substrate-binding protein [Opitutales bacterium]